MKVLVTNYTFNAASKTITFGDYASISLDSVLLVTNVTDNIIIYNFADATKGGTVATNVLTLAYDTTAMSNTDSLQIYYDDPTATQAISNATASNLNTVVFGYDGSGNPALSTDATGAVKLAAGTNAVGTLAANSGVDIGDVTINNAAGASAVNIQDGGNSITVDGTVNATAAGDVASGATDSGNPVKVGTKYNSTMPTVTDGQRVELQTTNRGVLQVQVGVGTGGATAQAAAATNADGQATSSLGNHVEVVSRETVYNGTTFDRAVSVGNGTNSTGTGIAAAGIVAQFDDTTPTSITENQFGNVRMSANRNLYGTIRDAAGNERGANVNSSNQLSVSADNVVPGTGATNLGKAIDSASGSTDTGVASLAVRDDALSALTPVEGDYVPLRVDANGGLWVSLATKLNSTDDAVTAVQAAQTSGGATPYKLISAATTNATSVKGSAGQLYGIQVYNTNAAARYLKLYNKASAPTVGTDTPVKVITIPGNTAGAGSNVAVSSIGIAFGTGIAFAITTGAADSDTGAVAANEIIVNLDYK